MLILRGEIGKKQGRLQTTHNPQAEHDLDRILKKWKFGGKTFTDTQDFIDKMGGWVDKQIEKDKELTDFLKFYGINSLKEIKGIELQEAEKKEREN